MGFRSQASVSGKSRRIPHITPAHRRAAAQALSCLDADYADDWSENTQRCEAERDPDNAPLMRPSVIKACQSLGDLPAIGLRCACGHAIGYLAVGKGPIGMLVVDAPSRQRPQQRAGGWRDLAPVGNEAKADGGFLLGSWDSWLRFESGGTLTASRVQGALGNAGQRREFTCQACGTIHRVRQVGLMRLLLRATADGHGEVRLGRLPGTA